MKKVLLTTTAIALLGAGMIAQNKRVGANSLAGQVKSATEHPVRCSTPVPAHEWDVEFNQMVENYKKTLPAGKASAATYTIPIIFHIIYTQGEAVGSGHNITQAQVNSQIPILNADYNGTGYNANTYTAMTSGGHPAFYDYAVAASLPAPDNNGVVIASSGVTFCLATKDKNGATLAEPGIERITWNSISGATNPQSSSNIQGLFDGTIKPATIWDPTKYFNVWVSDGGSSGLLGYATFPPGTTLSGLSGTGTSTTDGVWVNYTAVGNTGAAAAPYNLGRSLTHESGHWLGLRHIWGDGNCVTDYCNDTPPAAQANFVNCGTAYPYNANTCAGTPTAGNGADGEMYMNFMDYSNDCGMWMFTTDQVTRMQTAMSQSPYRNGLTASAVNLCNATASAPVAAFNVPANVCAGSAAQFTDASSGPPTSWSWSVTPSAGVTISTATSQNPSITFTTPGTYSVSLTASNTQGNSSVTHTVSVQNCTQSYTCPDTLRNFKATDTLTIFRSGSGSTGGYVSGNNQYGDLEKGEYYSGTGLPSNPNVTGGIILYYRDATANKGTKGTATLTISMYPASSTTGPTAAAVATKTVAINTITALTPVKGVHYCGNPNLQFSTAIIYPYDFNFTAAQPITGGFILSTTLPANGTDTAAVFMTSGKTASASTAFEKQSSGTWFRFNDGTANSWQLNSSLAILPKMSCTSAINNPNGIANHIAMFPNPSDGNFNLAVTMPEKTDLTFSVINTLGQTVLTKVEKGVTNSIINLDLSDKAKGVYYINVSCEKSSAILKAIVR